MTVWSIPKKRPFKQIIDLFKALIRNSLKFSCKKCKLFKTKLVYMGHQLLIEDRTPKITPIKSRMEAIIKPDPLNHQKVVNNFVEW